MRSGTAVVLLQKDDGIANPHRRYEVRGQEIAFEQGMRRLILVRSRGGRACGKNKVAR